VWGSRGGLHPAGSAAGPVRLCRSSRRRNDRNLLARQKCRHRCMAGLGVPVEMAGGSRAPPRGVAPCPALGMLRPPGKAGPRCIARVRVGLARWGGLFGLVPSPNPAQLQGAAPVTSAMRQLAPKPLVPAARERERDFFADYPVAATSAAWGRWCHHVVPALPREFAMASPSEESSRGCRAVPARGSAAKPGVDVGREERGPVLASPARGFPARCQHSPRSQAGTPCSLGSGFRFGARLCPRGWAGTCSGAGWGPHGAWVAAASPRRWPPPGEPPSPAPAFSRETLDLQRQLCHKSGFSGGLPGWHTPVTLALPRGGGLPVPGSVSGGRSVHGKAKGGASGVRAAPPSTTLGPLPRDPGVQERATPSLTAQDPPWQPPAPPPRSALGCLSRLPRGGRWDGGRAVPPAAAREPTSLPPVVTVAVAVAARPRVPPGAPPACCARRRAPRIPWLFLGWPYQPSCPGCLPARLSHRARHGGNPAPGSPQPCGKLGTPGVAGTAWGNTRGARGASPGTGVGGPRG